MQAFNEYKNMELSFWAFIKYISEKIGYTDRATGTVKVYSIQEIKNLCRNNNVNASNELIQDACTYVQLRAELLNNFVKAMLMDAEAAKEQYIHCERLHHRYNYRCKLPMNKQKGDMKQVAFFTAIINILAEKTIREETGIDALGFDDDPHSLMYIWDENNRIIGASSRRFDGAYPSIKNPVMVWEIKEYYYATTFGSRVADGVYETQLDGYEFNEIYDRTGRKVIHILFIDSYRTWWVQGKSYLCRIIDAMNKGIVDEVIVGCEVLTRWPDILRGVIRHTDL